jgi:hypothetical protein
MANLRLTLKLGYLGYHPARCRSNRTSPVTVVKNGVEPSISWSGTSNTCFQDRTTMFSDNDASRRGGRSRASIAPRPREVPSLRALFLAARVVWRLVMSVQKLLGSSGPETFLIRNQIDFHTLRLQMVIDPFVDSILRAGTGSVVPDGSSGALDSE